LSSGAGRALGRRYPVETLAESPGEGMPEFVFDGEDVGVIITYLKVTRNRRAFLAECIVSPSGGVPAFSGPILSQSKVGVPA
jgi:hypothetical protein